MNLLLDKSPLKSLTVWGATALAAIQALQGAGVLHPGTDSALIGLANAIGTFLAIVGMRKAIGGQATVVPPPGK